MARTSKRDYSSLHENYLPRRGRFRLLIHYTFYRKVSSFHGITACLDQRSRVFPMVFNDVLNAQLTYLMQREIQKSEVRYVTHRAQNSLADLRVFFARETKF